MNITANIISRVFRIKSDIGEGTGFSIDVDGKQYLVTARHLVPNQESESVLFIYHEDEWKRLAVVRIPVSPEEVDVAVFAPSQKLSNENLRVQPSSEGVVFGGDVYFMGFPYGWFNDIATMNSGFPLALVKKGIVSGMVGLPVTAWLLDGHNNPGFSGGPVLFEPAKSRNQLQVFAVISGYRYIDQPILDHSTGENTEYAFQYNTGIIVAYDIRYAVEAIRQHPIGYQLEDQG